MTFYKFAERQASTQVNWAELSKNMSDTFLEEQRLREEKKAAIDKETSQYATTLEQQPLSENVSMKEFWLKASEDLREAKLMSTRLLKEGKMRLTDYTVFSQNLQDGTNNFIDAMKRYNEEYKTKRERLMSQDPANASQLLEAWEMEQLQGLTDLANTKVYIDPTTGAMTMAKMTKKVVDGKEVMTMSDERVSANQIMNMLGSKYNKFDLNGALAGEEKNIGKYTDVITMAVGPNTSIIEYENPERRTGLNPNALQSINDFYTYRDNMVESYTSNPLNVSSILTDYTNKGYSFTEDPNDKDPMKILVKKTSSGLTPIFEGEKGKQQLKVASDYIKNKFMNMIDVTERAKGISRPPSAGGAGGGGGRGRVTPQSLQQAEGWYKTISNLFKGVDLQSTIDQLNNINNVSIVRDPNKKTVTVQYAATTGKEDLVIPLDGLTEDQFVRRIYTSILPEQTLGSMNMIVNNKGKVPSTYTPLLQGGVVGRAEDRSPTGDKVVRSLDATFSTTDPQTGTKTQNIPNTKAAYAEAMNKSLAKYQMDGKQLIKIVPANTRGNVYIVDQNGNPISENYYIASDDAATRQAAHSAILLDINNYINGLTDDDVLDKFEESLRNEKYPAKVE